MLYLEYFMADKHYIGWIGFLVLLYIGTFLVDFLSRKIENKKVEPFGYKIVLPIIFSIFFVFINLINVICFYSINTERTNIEKTIKGSVVYLDKSEDGLVRNKIVSENGEPRVCDVAINSYDFDDIDVVDKEFVPPQSKKYYIVSDLSPKKLECVKNSKIDTVVDVYHVSTNGNNVAKFVDAKVEKDVRNVRLIITEEQKIELLKAQKEALNELNKKHEVEILNRIKSAKEEGKIFLD